MSLKLRLNLAIAILSSLALLGMIAFIMVDAGPRMKAENDSIMRLTETLVRSSANSLRDSNDPRAALERLVASLRDLRHVTVSLASDVKDAAAPVPESEVNSWWAAEEAEEKPVAIPVDLGSGDSSAIVITPRPDDELNELWDAVFRIFEWGVFTAIVSFAFTSFIIHRALQPVQELRSAMRLMEDGNYETRVEESGTPEIRSICSGLNRLSSALSRARQENQSLTSGMILIQDSERREIARELHDELGPYLFSIRTDGAMLSREIDKGVPDNGKAKTFIAAILRQSDLLQQTNRRVLERLTPAGLSELGLKGALEAMVQLWRRDRTGTDLDLSILGPVDNLDDTTKLTIYRIVQEGLTNAFRHSEATRIAVEVFAPYKSAGSEGDANNILVSVLDNGKGRGETHEGFGLKAMRERITALSGQIAISTSLDGGTALRASLPPV